MQNTVIVILLHTGTLAALSLLAMFSSLASNDVHQTALKQVKN